MSEQEKKSARPASAPGRKGSRRASVDQTKIYGDGDEVNSAIEHFGDDQVQFMADPVCLNAVSMPIQQIGELAKHLSEAFQESNPQIPWRQIKGMRIWFAHQYLEMVRDVIWEVMHEGIPPLKTYCDALLHEG